MMAELVRNSPLPEEIEDIGRRVIGCAIEVHRTLGPGFLERLYEDAFVYELGAIDLRCRRQFEISVPYKHIRLEGQRLDLLVEDAIVVELKAVSAIADIHTAQVLSYLRAANMPLGLIFNFNTLLLKDAMKRIINDRWLPPGSSHPIFPVRSVSPSSSSPSSPSR